MGLMKDPRYWGRAISQIEVLLPMPGETMPAENAVRILRVACRCLSELVADPDFESDVAEAVAIGARAIDDRPTAFPDFEDFLDRFRDAERAALTQSGVDMDAIVHIEGEMRELMGTLDHNDLYRLQDKLQQAQSVCCAKAKDPKFIADPDVAFAKDMGNAVMGIGIIGVDLWVVTTTGTAVGALVANSIPFGASKMRNLLRHIW